MSQVVKHSSEMVPNAQAEHYKETFENGSKSFSLAALLFDRERQIAARYLYSWCRHCDDAVDTAPTVETAQARLRALQQETHEALQGGQFDDPAFAALSKLCHQYGIPTLYPLELLEGMRMDVERHHYRTQADLELYCYRVASVVGLMMVHVMGVSNERALQHAADTGLAMQMTNIARDIREDFEMGRIYIPDTWFLECGILRPSLQDGFEPADFIGVTQKLLQRADELYASGRDGLQYLPFRAALAVSAAQRIYREIGCEVLKRGSDAWESRCVVSLPKKLLLLALSVGDVLRLKGAALLRPFRSVEVHELYPPERVLNRLTRLS